jgi:excisionase family DNA binding protein
VGEKKIRPDELEFLSINNIAERTTFHRKTIERFIREGRLKTVKVGGRRLITRRAFIEFLNAESNDNFQAK